MTQTPKFRKPPVVEVALSVITDPTPGFTAAHIGLLWTAGDLRSRFPKTSDHPPVDAPVEQENEPQVQQGPRLEFQPLENFKLRSWFLNETETQLLQIQQDRISRNWRRAGTSEEYPSYDNIRGPFQDDLRLISEFFAANGLGVVRPKQAEVTYVNHIVPGEVWKHHGELHRVFVNWKNPPDNFLPKPEDATFVSRYVIRLHGNFVGRLHVSLQPAMVRASDGKSTQVFVFTLTARGKPLGKGIEGALEFLQLGHDWIVNAFADLTTEEMHQVWERTQ